MLIFFKILTQSSTGPTERHSRNHLMLPTGPLKPSTGPSLITIPSCAVRPLPSSPPTMSSMHCAQPLPPSALNSRQYPSPSTMSSQPFQGFSTQRSEGFSSSAATTTLSPEQRTRTMRNRALALRKRKASSQDSSQDSSQVSSQVRIQLILQF